MKGHYKLVLATLVIVALVAANAGHAVAQVQLKYLGTAGWEINRW
jgi:hypothetical protein